LLADALAPISASYDFILIDCAPSLGLLTVNALVAAAEVLIPLQADFLSMRGLSILLDVIDTVRKKLNPDLSIAGMLLTMYSPRTRHSREVLDELRGAFGNQVYPMVIPGSVRFRESPAAGLSIIEYDSAHAGAEAYRELARRIAA
jgi:chromosome partitioning protein